MSYFAFFNAKFLPNRQVSSIQAGWIVQLREARIWLSDVQAAEDTVSMFLRGRLGLWRASFVEVLLAPCRGGVQARPRCLWLQVAAHTCSCSAVCVLEHEVFRLASLTWNCGNLRASACSVRHVHRPAYGIALSSLWVMCRHEQVTTFGPCRWRPHALRNGA